MGTQRNIARSKAARLVVAIVVLAALVGVVSSAASARRSGRDADSVLHARRCGTTCVAAKGVGLLPGSSITMRVNSVSGPYFDVLNQTVADDGSFLTKKVITDCVPLGYPGPATESASFAGTTEAGGSIESAWVSFRVPVCPGSGIPGTDGLNGTSLFGPTTLLLLNGP